jgi:hypothetical protein
MIAASSSGVSTGDRASFGPIRLSSTLARLRHFRTVLGLIPKRSASAATEAFDRCHSARTACVVLAQPWSTWPIAPSSADGRIIHHHNPGLNT